MRKERILHTRISEQLAEDIREVADELRVPVSNLVRNVLEEAFTVAERVRDDVGDLLDEVMDEAEKASTRYVRFRQRQRARDAARESSAGESAEPEPRRPAAPAVEDAAVSEVDLAARFPEVIAWQPVVLNAARRCARTGQEIAAGERAFLGLGEAGPTGVLVRSLESDLPD
jgi:antitoxin component of RelBE/YafQ-DinJ toxin-antitoxin module